jgi:hypothetical protein
MDPRLVSEEGLDLPSGIGDMLERRYIRGQAAGLKSLECSRWSAVVTRESTRRQGDYIWTPPLVAGTSLLNDLDLFKPGTMYDAETMIIDGINAQGDPLTTSTKGQCVMGTAYYHPDGLASVLCFADLVDTAHSVDYDKLRDRFLVEYEQGDEVYAFHRHRRTNTYVCDVRGSPAVLASLTKPRMKTVTELEKMHSPRECADARIARQRMRNMLIAPGKLMKMLRANKIKGAEITPLDVARCIQIYGKGMGFIKGTETAHKSEQDCWEPAADQVPKDHIMEVDLMLLNDKAIFMVGLARPSNHALVKELNGKRHARANR